MVIDPVKIGQLVSTIGTLVPGITGIVVGTGTLIDKFADLTAGGDTPERRIIPEIEAGHQVNVERILAENDGDPDDDNHHSRKVLRIQPFMFSAAIDGIKSALKHHQDDREQEIISLIVMLMAMNLEDKNRFQYGVRECSATQFEISNEIKDPPTLTALTKIFNEYQQKLLEAKAAPAPSVPANPPPTPPAPA